MALKVFNFRCVNGHCFEAMVPSVKDFERQRDAGLFTCPYCETSNVQRALSAPHVSTKSASRKEDEKMAVLENFYKELSSIIDKAENVGDKFPQEARAIFRGEAPEKAIIGTAKTEEVEELLEEGVPILPLGPQNKNSVN